MTNPFDLSGKVAVVTGANTGIGQGIALALAAAGADIAAVGRAFAMFHVRHHTIARILNYELAALSAEHRAEIDELRTGIDRELRALVTAGVEAGAFDIADPALAATALASMGIDIARWYREDGEWTPEEIGDFYADLALRLAGASPRR